MRGSPLHMAAENGSANIAQIVLLRGGCRFLRNAEGRTPLDLAAGDNCKGVLKVFASGVDYWQRRYHSGHAWSMKEAVITLLLVRERLGALASTAPSPLPHLPEEIWLALCAFLRSADFL